MHLVEEKQMIWLVLKKIHDLIIGQGNICVSVRYFCFYIIFCYYSVCYSPDGKCVLAGGNSKYIGLYYIKQNLLLSRYITTINKDIEAVSEQLNTSKIAEIGYMSDNNNEELSDYEYRDTVKLIRKQLPGVQVTDYSSRKFKPQIRFVSLLLNNNDWQQRQLNQPTKKQK